MPTSRLFSSGYYVPIIGNFTVLRPVRALPPTQRFFAYAIVTRVPIPSVKSTCSPCFSDGLRVDVPLALCRTTASSVGREGVEPPKSKTAHLQCVDLTNGHADPYLVLLQRQFPYSGRPSKPVCKFSLTTLRQRRHPNCSVAEGVGFEPTRLLHLLV